MQTDADATDPDPTDATHEDASNPMGRWSQSTYVKGSIVDPQDRFGKTLALSEDGSTLAIGLRSASTVDVYTREGESWSHQQRLNPPDSLTNNGFGATLSLSRDGTVLAVGAPLQTSKTGAVFVFEHNTQWTQTKLITATMGGVDDTFGSALALSPDGDTLVVGAQWEDSSNTNPNNNNAHHAGAAYIFSRVVGDWSQTAYLKATTPVKNDLFGHAVSVNGDGTKVAVTATWRDTLQSGAGAVYIFEYQTEWIEQAMLTTSREADHLGAAVSLSRSGKRLVVSTTDRGALPAVVHTFFVVGTTWERAPALAPSNTGQSDRFGAALALHGDTLVVGARNEDAAGSDLADNSAANAGAAYVYTWQETQWGQEEYLKASNVDAEDQFGFSVAIDESRSTVVVGAPGEDSDSTGVNGNQASSAASNSGAVYIFERNQN